ncbi:TetR/AcrR family transcriptional regulator [Kribbella catacumbae]|uniref:TetR/AcrR family transcriptional regulator n=1 Tax=Kribbella catacumbae TaxID=460086 RepID=UPI000362BEFE|nr:TetR/AcrR family transcriptional regulator [Kribbella catacumbae]
MPAQQRKEKAREERSRLIVDAARELAEAEGWDAVTTRKLAEKVEYSQPVLYSHFKNMDAIASAVALQGFEELTVALTEGVRRAKLRGLADAYLAFAREHPALYQAMFVRRSELTFAVGEIPASLRAAFAVFLAAVDPYADGATETLAELFWSSLHGLATLQAGKRLRPDHHENRVELLVNLVAVPTDRT